VAAQFTAVFEKHDHWWLGFVREVPGANTQGRTLAEARENLKEALAMMLESHYEAARGFEGPNAIVENITCKT